MYFPPYFFPLFNFFPLTPIFLPPAGHSLLPPYDIILHNLYPCFISGRINPDTSYTVTIRKQSELIYISADTYTFFYSTMIFSFRLCFCSVHFGSILLVFYDVGDRNL